MSGKFLVNVSFDLVAEDDVKTLSDKIQECLKKLAEDNYLFVSQLSIYQQKNPYSGEPLVVNKDGTRYVEKFDIKNVTTSIL